MHDSFCSRCDPASYDAFLRQARRLARLENAFDASRCHLEAFFQKIMHHQETLMTFWWCIVFGKNTLDNDTQSHLMHSRGKPVVKLT